AADESTLDRVHELVQRTTQFNTTTRRRSPAELAELLADPAYDCRITSLRDRFGDLGVVGVVIAHREGTRLTFDSVIMSCRAMGFGLELAMIASALEAAGDWETAVGVYAPTDRNGPCAQVFASAGFAAMSPEEWLLTRDAASPVPVPEWLDVR